MKSYILKRILSLIPVLFVVSIVIFMIIHITPGDPASVILGEEATPEQINELREELGLNEPAIQQYLHWIGNVFKGDLGDSYFMKQSVLSAIISHLGPTLSLAILAQLVALLIAIPAGILAARRRGTTVETVMGAALLGMAIPSFLLALFLVLLVGVKLQWLPVAGYQPLDAGLWDHLQYLIMPAISLGSIQAALIARMTRTSMLEVLNTNYIKTARAKGVEERLLFMDMHYECISSDFNSYRSNFGGLVAGAVVTETIFNIPGIGQFIINSVERRDYTVIQGIVLFITFVYVFINLNHRFIIRCH